MTIFLLSPARTGGERAALLARSGSPLGERLRGGDAQIGDVFAWLSALYFRGKLTYARRFGRALVMAPGLGLVAPELAFSAEMLVAMGKIAIESRAFVEALDRDARAITEDRVVLLGSIATGKYLDTLLAIFGERLLFPESFVGRGDMSRGGLLLRAAKSGEELVYRPVAGAIRHGVRPPKLPRLTRPPRR
ncbi:MAG TPA: hypothetical protein VL463_15145 [Kofleriaceae bacterium]|nr:hypothetical protein [Kofleriaceae bacterium]